MKSASTKIEAVYSIFPIPSCSSSSLFVFGTSSPPHALASNMQEDMKRDEFTKGCSSGDSCVALLVHRFPSSDLPMHPPPDGPEQQRHDQRCEEEALPERFRPDPIDVHPTAQRGRCR